MEFSQIFKPRVTIKDKAFFYESIANLLDGGITLISALHGFTERVEHLGLKEASDNLLFFLEGGDALSVAMRKLPNFFGEQEIAIIESGEQTGMLQDSFMALAKEMREMEELRGKVIGSLTYPFIIFIFLMIAIAVVMIYVIPQILPIISQMTGEIPLATRALIGMSQFLQNNYIFLLLLLVGIGLVFQGYISTESGRKKFDRFLITAPLIGNVYKNYIIVRVMRTFHLLISSGITIVKTIRLTGASSGNKIIEEIYHHIANNVAHGKKITESMQEADPTGFFFSSNIVQMVENGEKTSTLDRVTDKLSNQYRREVDLALGVMVKFIEPIALLIAGIFVLWFAVAIFSAIMQIVSLAGN